MPNSSSHPDPLPPITAADLVEPKLKVADTMSADPRTCSPFSSTIEAVLIFRDADCGLIPVVDEEGKPLGVVTDRDVALALPQFDAELARTSVQEVMTADVVTITTDASLEDALQELAEEGVRRLLVVDSEGLLQGILSWTDLVPHVSDRALGAVVARIALHQRET